MYERLETECIVMKGFGAYHASAAWCGHWTGPRKAQYFYHNYNIILGS